MNEKKLQMAIQAYLKKRKLSAAYYQENWQEREERKAYYQSFKQEQILSMSEDDLLEYISKLWSMIIWGNKKYVVNKLIEDNGFDHLKKRLVQLLYGKEPVDLRWDSFLKTVKGMGPATISELLTYVNPKEYVIFNKTTISCFTYLGVVDLPKYNYQYTGRKYVEACENAKVIAERLNEAGLDADLLMVDYFLWDEVLPLAEKGITVQSIETDAVEKVAGAKEVKSIHEEIKEKLVAIGQFLGFESRAEVTIGTGAVVDVVWEAKIGNMGKAIYVFEVQSRGSIDSLILNLRKALNNPAVQAVVAVADEEQLSKILKESKGVIDEKDLRTWEIDDVLAVHDALLRAHESINKLALVPDSFKNTSKK